MPDLRPLRTRLPHGIFEWSYAGFLFLSAAQAKDGSRESLRGKFQRAGWDNTYLARLLTLF